MKPYASLVMLALLVVAGCQSPPKSEPAPFVVTSGRGFQMLKPNSTNTVITDDQPYYVLSGEQLVVWFQMKNAQNVAAPK